MAEPVLVTHNQYRMRVYDGTGTPFYVVVPFYDLPTTPGRAPRPATSVIAGGGRLEAGNVAAVIEDETPTMAPLPWTLTFRLDNEQAYIVDAFGNPLDRAAWEVGSTPDTWTPVLKADIGTRNNSEGNAIPCIPPVHADELAGMYNVEEIYGVPPGGTGAAIVKRLLGCVTKDVTFTPIPGGVNITLSIETYGAVAFTTAFTTGAESN